MDNLNPYAAPQADISPIKDGKTPELATLGQRFQGFLLDVLAGSPSVVLLVMFVGMAENNQRSTSPLGLILLVTGFLYFIGLMVYNIIRLSSHGQTIGKKWIGTRIAKIEDNSNPGFVKAFILRGVVSGIIGALPVVGFIYALLDICFIFQENRRCIHDLLAGTHVVKV